jgi:type IV pilus assembly protein PilY1
VLGNYVNWLKGPSTTYRSKIDIAKDVVTNLIQSTDGVNFGLMKFNDSEGGTFIKQSISGVDYVTTIKNMSDIHTGTITNRTALINVVNGYTASTWTPLAETMYEALLYFKGDTAKFGTVGLTNGKYTSPIKASCQKNYIILVTDGMSTEDKNAILGTAIGDFDGDHADPGTFDYNGSHYLDDVAKYLYDKDLLPDDNAKPETIGTQRVTTFTIGFGLSGSDADAVSLLNRAADSNHGHGQAFLASDQTGLAEALTQVISNILETNSSFVAPVVPVSPENKTASASRMYIGLFKPTDTGAWEGNLKKFGLDSRNNLVDKNGNWANYVDLNGDGWDDRNPTTESLPNGKVNGSFRDSSISFWSTSIDKGDVNSGGAGALLQARDPATRKIYTYFTNATITDTSNVFAKTNTSITPALLGVVDTTAKDDLIGFIRGTDTYDDNNNGSTTDNRDWVMGDILHSKPTVVNYKKYDFNVVNEANCSVNKTMIYVGSNDGLLHAIRDCDGTEAWAFIPPDLLPNLKFLHSATHTNFNDSTVTAYVYDNPSNNLNNSPNELFIDPASTLDKVLLLVGQRRGGGTNSVPAKGYYYLLDATDPENPKYISRFSNGMVDFTELAETWSEPKVEKIKVGSAYKIAAIFGGGYDNLNEDSRYGKNQSYLGTGGVTNADTGAGFVTSTGSAAALNPKGRGIYIVEVATIVGTTMDFTNSGSLIWSYTNTTNPTDMKYSIAGEIATVDTRGRGYIDRLYATDSAGNLWRFNIGAYYSNSLINDSWSNSTTTNWKGLKVFTPNPGSLGATDVGRKAFYKPAVILDYCYDSTSSTMVNCDMVFYGTGDREHPLNKNVTDRMYMVKVRDKDITGKTECAATATDLSNCLLDVTTDQLQTSEIVNTSLVPTSPTVGSVPYILKQIKESSGWYIKLDENAGEKVLSSPRVINKVAYFTSYVPTNSDPCQIANPGDSYVYILNYLTGEAAMNLDSTNDAASAAARTTTNIRQAKNSASVVVRSDRKGLIGQGIASGVVVATSTTGATSVFLSSGGNIVPIKTAKGQSAKILYWRQK